MKDDKKYQNFLVKEYKYWKIYIHKNQSLLGRSYLWCKREDALDFLEMTEDERLEFFEVAKVLKRALIKLFNPDLFNYAALENETQHLHVHVIPRYSSGREFEGINFTDTMWGSLYRTKDDQELSKDVLFKVRDQIKEVLI